MRFTIIFTLATAILSTSASLVLRQTPPACYNTCAQKANYGNCSMTDAGCLCNDSTFITQTTTCLEQTCQGADLQASLNLGNELCLSVGVTLSASGTASGTGTTPTSSASSGGSVPATTPTSSASSSGSAPATTSQSAAAAHGPSAFIGFAAVGLVAALAL